MSNALDAITDKALAYRPNQHPLKVIAGTPDTPLRIGDIEIPCYVLEDETRVLSQGGFARAIGRTGGPKGGLEDLFNLPVFLRPRNLARFIPEDLSTSSRPIQFQALTGGSVATGYRATALLPTGSEPFPLSFINSSPLLEGRAAARWPDRLLVSGGPAGRFRPALAARPRII